MPRRSDEPARGDPGDVAMELADCVLAIHKINGRLLALVDQVGVLSDVGQRNVASSDLVHQSEILLSVCERLTDLGATMRVDLP